MPLGRQRDHSLCSSRFRTRTWATATILLAINRQKTRSPSKSLALMHAAAQYAYNHAEVCRFIQRSNRISFADFSFNFNALSDLACIQFFRLRKSDINRMTNAIAWPCEWTCTKRDRRGCAPTLVACIIFRRMCTPVRWCELEHLFGKPAPHLSEIFCEGLQRFLEVRLELITGSIPRSFIEENAERYAKAVMDKGQALNNCIGYIDGTVIAVARPGDSEMQNVCYNGHKRKHARKFQAINTPDGIIMHAYGPMKGRHHDWTLYVRSGVDEQLADLMVVDGVQYVIYGDSGYNAREFMDVPFQG